MVITLSPAKSLNLDRQEYLLEPTQAVLRSRSKVLVEHMKTFEARDLKELMHISDDLAALNKKRYKTFKKVHNSVNSKPAGYAFNGDVYRGLEISSLNKDDLLFAQDRLRILSGLYGILKPMDLIQAYRLEMGTKTSINGFKSLYAFWDLDITKEINKALKKSDSDILLNLASNEYFKSVKRKKVKADIIDVHFREYKNGELKFISYTAKVARGLLAKYAIKNRSKDVESLKGFDYDGYSFDSSLSSDHELFFVR